MHRRAATITFVMSLGLLGPVTGLSQVPANAWSCPQNALESDREWYERCNGLLATQPAASFDMAKLRATLQKQPALTADRNRLLGRWQQPPRPRAAQNDVFGQLAAAIGNGSCTALFGDGTVEFQADRWSVTDSDGFTDLGPVTYREGKDSTIFVLPQTGAQLLPLKLESADRWSLVGAAVPCVMTRAAAAAMPVRAPSPTPPVERAEAKLAVGPGVGGYSCPDGRQLYVKSCFDESPAADCGVVNIHLPLNGKYQVETLETRSKLASSVAGCKVYPVLFHEGHVSLAAPKHSSAQVAATSWDDAVKTAHALKLQRRYDEAEAAYRQAIALDKTKAAAFAGLGSVQEARKAWAEALDSYTRALALEAANRAAFEGKAVALYQLNRYAEALPMLDMIMLRDPNHWRTLIHRASTLDHLGRLDAAVADLDRAKTLKPDDVMPHVMLWGLYNRRHRYSEALPAIQAAVRLAPDDAKLREWLSATQHNAQLQARGVPPN